MKTTKEFLELPDGNEVEIEIEWRHVKNDCSSEFGNCTVTEKWDVYDSERVTNLKTGDAWDCDTEPEEEWEDAAYEALLNGSIVYER